MQGGGSSAGDGAGQPYATALSVERRRVETVLREQHTEVEALFEAWLSKLNAARRECATMHSRVLERISQDGYEDPFPRPPNPLSQKLKDTTQVGHSSSNESSCNLVSIPTIPWNQESIANVHSDKVGFTNPSAVPEDLEVIECISPATASQKYTKQAFPIVPTPSIEIPPSPMGNASPMGNGGSERISVVGRVSTLMASYRSTVAEPGDAENFKEDGRAQVLAKHEEEAAEGGFLGKLSYQAHWIVMTPLFKLVCSAVILANAAFIGIQADQRVKASVSANQSVPALYAQLGFAFASFFFLELVLRIVGTRWEFLCGKEWRWNVFDTVLVLLWIPDIFTENNAASVGTIFRILRVIRFFRILRLLRVINLFDSLRVLICSILGSLMNLLWVFMLLFYVIYIFSIIILTAVSDYFEDYIADPSSISAEFIAGHADMQFHYGGFYNCCVSLFMAISGGDDWGNFMYSLAVAGGGPTTPSAWVYETIFIFYIFFMVFGVLNVVVGTFVETAAAVARRDQEAIVDTELERVRTYAKDIRDFFMQADKDKDGTISWKEFEKHLQNDRVKALFQSLELDVSQAQSLFELLDTDNGGAIAIDEFLGGCMRLKGDAKSLDVNLLLYQNDNLSTKVEKFMEIVEQELHLGIGITKQATQASGGSGGSVSSPRLSPESSNRRRRRIADGAWIGGTSKAKTAVFA